MFVQTRERPVVEAEVIVSPLHSVMFDHFPGRGASGDLCTPHLPLLLTLPGTASLQLSPFSLLHMALTLPHMALSLPLQQTPPPPSCWRTWETCSKLVSLMTRSAAPRSTASPPTPPHPTFSWPHSIPIPFIREQETKGIPVISLVVVSSSSSSVPSSPDPPAPSRLREVHCS